MAQSCWTAEFVRLLGLPFNVTQVWLSFKIPYKDISRLIIFIFSEHSDNNAYVLIKRKAEIYVHVKKRDLVFLLNMLNIELPFQWFRICLIICYFFSLWWLIKGKVICCFCGNQCWFLVFAMNQIIGYKRKTSYKVTLHNYLTVSQSKFYFPIHGLSKGRC